MTAAINMAQYLTALTAFYGLPLLALILGVISLTRLITLDSIIEKTRDKFFIRFPYEGFSTFVRPKRGKFITTSGGGYYVNVGTKLGELIHCPWCTGFWVSTALWAVFCVAPVGTTFFLLPFGVRVLPGLFQALTD